MDEQEYLEKLIERRSAQGRAENAAKQSRNQDKQDTQQRAGFYEGYNCTTGEAAIKTVGGGLVPAEMLTNGLIRPGQPVRLSQDGTSARADQMPVSKRPEPQPESAGSDPLSLAILLTTEYERAEAKECSCPTWNRVDGKCKQVCDGTGEFSTLEECAGESTGLEGFPNGDGTYRYVWVYGVNWTVLDQALMPELTSPQEGYETGDLFDITDSEIQTSLIDIFVKKTDNTTETIAQSLARDFPPVEMIEDEIPSFLLSPDLVVQTPIFFNPSEFLYKLADDSAYSPRFIYTFPPDDNTDLTNGTYTSTTTGEAVDVVFDSAVDGGRYYTSITGDHQENFYSPEETGEQFGLTGIRTFTDARFLEYVIENRPEPILSDAERPRYYVLRGIGRYDYYVAGSEEPPVLTTVFQEMRSLNEMGGIEEEKPSKQTLKFWVGGTDKTKKVDFELTKDDPFESFISWDKKGWVITIKHGKEPNGQWCKITRITQKGQQQTFTNPSVITLTGWEDWRDSYTGSYLSAPAEDTDSMKQRFRSDTTVNLITKQAIAYLVNPEAIVANEVKIKDFVKEKTGKIPVIRQKLNKSDGSNSGEPKTLKVKHKKLDVVEPPDTIEIRGYAVR